ncbi:hypothetical protein [Halostreptopolyspora alba]|uniref:Uncharacterized protein n=1 Tax=Halostreptopolyspora alba TaxID=2487137 RepID=A0A3N0EGI2_9ACTN|nr:hypothetical protein EFW17_03260 [Nocardiopsaceae bacterium YIM 96095]
MSEDDAGFAHVLKEVPLFRPTREERRGRVSSTTLAPGDRLPTKVVIDFGSTPEGPDLGPDLEIATRAWDRAEEPGEREIRGFCGERDLMERRARDPLSAQSLSLPGDARWSSQTIEVDTVPRTFTVLRTSHSWVAVAALGAHLVRIFARAPGPGAIALCRITSMDELERVRGRG